MPIESCLEKIAASPDHTNIQLICELVDVLRPNSAHQTELVEDRLRALSYILTNHPEYAAGLRRYLVNIAAQRKIVHLFTDTGITMSEGFWSEVWKRLMYKALPPLTNDDYLRDVFGAIFNRVDDYVWIHAVNEQVWKDLIRAIGFKARESQTAQQGIINELLSSLQVLSYRISAIGLESELVRNYPDIERYESPFLRQNDEVNEFVNGYRAWLMDHRSPRRDSQHLEVLLEQCEEVIQKIRRIASVQGVSVSLTRLLLRVRQSIDRMRSLLALIEARNKDQVLNVSLQLFKELVRADNRKYSVIELIQANTDLLTIQVTEHAGRSGEHYVANSRKEWFSMLRSASGAGFIVGFMALIKIIFGKLALAPFGFAFLFSLNYSLGFMLVHVIHCTIATKQPAMTAALIARSLDNSKQNLDDLVALVIQVIRTQFIAIVGNVAIAMPTAYALAWIFYFSTGHHFVDPDKAQHLLADINPFASLALFHAAIAGVCLFLSGLISGYFDNKASYSQIPERLRQVRSMKLLFGERRWGAITDYIGNNLGALAGNFYFGIMLGSIGQIGVFLGLPIDIRHITFSSANFAIALAGLDHQVSWQVILVSLSGVALIGIVNLTVSFALALLVAMRSRNVSFEQSSSLLLILGKRFMRRSREFFIPPRDPA